MAEKKSFLNWVGFKESESAAPNSVDRIRELESQLNDLRSRRDITSLSKEEFEILATETAMSMIKSAQARESKAFASSERVVLEATRQAKDSLEGAETKARSILSGAEARGRKYINVAEAEAAERVAQAEREGYAGIFGPLDAMYVKARCLLEFSQVDAALIVFEQIRNLATAWKQYVWVYVAESFIARDLAMKGNTSGALELVRAGRDRVRENTFDNSLTTYCDLTELFIRYTVSDWARVGVLLERLPNFLLVQRIRSIYEVAMGKTPTAYDLKKMPNSTPRANL